MSRAILVASALMWACGTQSSDGTPAADGVTGFDVGSESGQTTPPTDGAVTDVTDISVQPEITDPVTDAMTPDDGVGAEVISTEDIVAEAEVSAPSDIAEPQETSGAGGDASPDIVDVQSEVMADIASDDGGAPPDIPDILDIPDIPPVDDTCTINQPGAAPIPESVTAAGATISNVQLNGGGNAAVGVAAGSTVTVTFDHQIFGVSCSGCPGCVTQYFVGLVDEAGSTVDKSCWYSGSSGCNGAINGTSSVELTAPATPGTYTIGFTFTWHYSCGEGESMYKTPDPGTTFAAFCVGEPPPPQCGNGIVEDGEECDTSGDSATCTDTCKTKGCAPSLTGDVTSVQTFDQQLVDWATPIDLTVALPDSSLSAAKVTMHVTIGCPGAPGDCDPWDRFGNLELVDPEGDGHNIEVGRFITPYDITGFGPDSCEWEYDVSGYQHLLRSDKILRLFISSWIGAPDGWLVSVRFDFHHGQVPFESYKVVNLWKTGYLVLGDPAQPVAATLVPQTVTIDGQAAKGVVRFTTTGHGQGNTNNAAEFWQTTHTLSVAGQDFPWVLWRGDCATNTCSPQGGNWTSGRAGWCPGDRVVPHDVDVSSQLSPGGTTSFAYTLPPYENCCRPDNPSCNAADSSCCMSFAGECNYNYTGHTEPNYNVNAQLILYKDACAEP